MSFYKIYSTSLIILAGICFMIVAFLQSVRYEKKIAHFENPRYKEIYILEKNGDIIGGTIVSDCWDFTSVKTKIQYRGCINKRNVDMELEKLMKAIPPYE